MDDRYYYISKEEIEKLWEKLDIMSKAISYRGNGIDYIPEFYKALGYIEAMLKEISQNEYIPEEEEETDTWKDKLKRMLAPIEAEEEEYL